MTTTYAATTPRSSRATVARAAGTALLVAALGNALLYLAATASGLLGPSAVAALTQEVGLGMVLFMSILPPVMAAALFALLVRFTPRPGAIFVVGAALVFAAFFVGPFTLGAPIGAVAVLETMHLVVAAPVVWLLLRTLR